MAKKTNLEDEEKYYSREDFMTEKEMKEVDNRLSKLITNRGTMADLYSRWEDEEVIYKGDQPTVANRPNTRVNIVNAIIEGQVSALTEQNLAITTRGESPADKQFADWARIGLDWALRKNKIKRIIEVHERRRLKFGAAILKVYFDEYAINGFGLPTICCPPLTKIYIDNKVKDFLRFQEAEYIAETIRLSEDQFETLYGEDKASAVHYGSLFIEDTTTFKEDYTVDDQNSATLIQWYEKEDGKLRLLEFTADGLLLFDSNKGTDRTENQRDNKKKAVPYYKNVNNKYPFFFTGLYPEEGQLFGFGDAKLLKPIQEMLNDIYDKIRIAARPNLILFDPSSEVDLEDFGENSFEPRPAMLTQQAVQVVQWGQVNPALWQLLNNIHQEAQKVTRYSDLMTGQGKTSGTATEAAIQQTQGNATTDHKKLMFEETLVEVCEYMLGLMMEFYKGAKAFRVQDDKDSYEWIDFRQLTKVPVMKPATASFKKQYGEKRKENGEVNETPQWEILTDDSNNPLTKNIDLDIEIEIGAGLPKNKAFLWQMIQQLSTMVVLDAAGQQHNLISYEEMRKLIKDFVGLPLEEKTQEDLMQQPQMIPGQPGQPMGQPNAQQGGLTAGGGLGGINPAG